MYLDFICSKKFEWGVTLALEELKMNLTIPFTDVIKIMKDIKVIN